mmetsp:Transcript_10873/g.32735  ORF Transcript_10873/g.32735 Transcript_10873/m.32735 type:complete len:101 (-) Transcript_10873:135-437(-)
MRFENAASCTLVYYLSTSNTYEESLFGPALGRKLDEWVLEWIRTHPDYKTDGDWTVDRSMTSPHYMPGRIVYMGPGWLMPIMSILSAYLINGLSLKVGRS